MFDRLRSRIQRAVAAAQPRAPHEPVPPPRPYDAGAPARAKPGKWDDSAGARDLGMSRVDGWQNLTTGMGDPSRDKLTYGSFAPVRNLGYGEIESLYYGDDMCERIVDSLPDEAFRRGFTLEGPLAEKVLDAFKVLRVETKLRDGYGWGRLWGGAGLVLGLDDGQTQEKPLDVARVRGLKFINVVDRRYINPLSYYEKALSPEFGKPETYQVTPAFGHPGTWASAQNNIVVHETRLIKFNGTRIDDITTRRLGGWSYSVLQRPYEIVRLFASAFQASGQLMNDAGQAVFSVKGLLTQMSGPNGNAILQRFATLDQQRWAGRMILADKDNEEFHREPVQVAGVDKMLEHFEMRMAAAARMPVTMLMGRSPSGMDATGDSDTRQWYASVKAAQTNDLEPAIIRLADIVTAGGWSEDEENKIIWTAMEEPNDKEEAEVEKLTAEKWQIYQTIGAISGEQVALVEFANQPMAEVIDEDVLTTIVEAEYELAKNPPKVPDPSAIPVVPGKPVVMPPPKAPAVPVKADAELPFGQRNAAFLGDLRDYRDNGLHLDQATVDLLAEKHRVPAPRLKD